MITPRLFPPLCSVSTILVTYNMDAYFSQNEVFTQTTGSVIHKFYRVTENNRTRVGGDVITVTKYSLCMLGSNLSVYISVCVGSFICKRHQ